MHAVPSAIVYCTEAVIMLDLLSRDALMLRDTIMLPKDSLVGRQAGREPKENLSSRPARGESNVKS
jgi:hypothetical protein